MFGACTIYKYPNLVTLCTRRYSMNRVHFAQTHYEVLELKETCADAEIKEAFYKKMKLLHPDKNTQNSKNHKLAVAVNEAYAILGKPHSRENYDYHLSQLRGQHYHNSMESDIPYDRVVFRDSYNLYQRTVYPKRGFPQDDTLYYGVKGVKRLPNSYIAAGAVLFMIFGAMFHFYITSISSRYCLKKLDEKDEKLRQIYENIRENAIATENGEQMGMYWNKLQKNEIGKQSKLSNSHED